jgi:membrane associated rhomboid family serine protease
MIVTFILDLAIGLDANQLGFSTMGLLRSQVWILITAPFIHVGVMHLAGNILFLYIFGNTLEEEIGSTKTIGLFFFGGAAALLIGIPFNPPNTHIVGSSIAVSTLLGAVILIKPNKYSPVFFAPLGLVAVIYIIYNGFMIYYGQAGPIAYVSHVIGFLIGIPLGLAWRRKRVSHDSRNL